MNPGRVTIFYSLYVGGLALAIVAQVWWTQRKRRRKALLRPGFPIERKSPQP